MENSPKVLINPKPADKVAGFASTVAFDSPEFLAGLSLMYGLRPHEQITQVEITDEGITSRIDRVSSPAPAGSK